MANPVLNTGWSYFVHHSARINSSPSYILIGVSADKKSTTYQECLDTEYKSIVGSPQVTVVHHNSGSPIKNH